MKSYHATKIDDLPQLIEFLRDRFIETDRIRSCECSGTLVLPTDVLDEDKQTVLAAKLTVANVTSFEVVDPDSIGEIQISHIRIRGNALEIGGQTPAYIRASVSSVNLLLEVTEEIVRKVSRIRSSFLRS